MKTRLVALALAACQGPDAGDSPGDPTAPIPIPADPQRTGDPDRGYEALVNNGYVSCGIPYTAYSQVFADAAPELRLPGRNAENEALPYFYNRFDTPEGVDVVSANCLSCHAGYLMGELVVGLGDTHTDFTTADEANVAIFAQLLVSDPAEKAEIATFAERLNAIGPYTEMPIVGVNPADNLAAALFAHRDPATLAWSTDPLIPLPQVELVPVDVPPWWRMAKKNAMFYVAAGRGDHARIEMSASALCTDSVAEAEQIDTYFPDIGAFIASIQPPPFPFPVDADLADEGQAVFEATCSRCHGTYGPDGAYPNLLVPLATIGTDPALGAGATQFADAFVDWFNTSFYGEVANLEPQAGYVAPPLDGIWATAPFLHNGSVPTIAALLDSASRPTWWSRSYDSRGVYDSTDYDEVNVGWRYTDLDHGHDQESDAFVEARLYDTTLEGFGNGGHTFGDDLTEADRAAVIEYLKTL